MKTLIIVSSYHHHNTLKVARAMAGALRAEVVSPDQVNPDTLLAYDLVGFGSGIYDAMHHRMLLKLADSLPTAEGRKAFLFSTDGTPRLRMIKREAYKRKMVADHLQLRRKLEAKGYRVVGDFNCAGFNTNVFLKFFGGVNKGRPSADDLALAANFAGSLSAI
ncbi:MAG: flavodoxin family protein [Bacillota bacterium]